MKFSCLVLPVILSVETENWATGYDCVFSMKVNTAAYKLTGKSLHTRLTKIITFDSYCKFFEAEQTVLFFVAN